MLEDLKKEAAATSTGLQFGRLTVFVAACIVLAGLLVLGQTCASWGSSSPTEEDEPETPDPVATAPERIPIDVLLPRITRVVDPDGTGRSVERLDAWADEAVEWMRLNVEGEPSSAVATRVTPSALGAMPRDEALGRVFEVSGEVVERAEQVWGTGTGRLWSLVIADADGNQVVASSHALATDVQGGAPRDAYFGAGTRKAILPGQHVIVRGYYLQRRSGTVGGTVLPQPTPVLWAMSWRRTLHASDRVPPVAGLDAVDWDGVRDRLFAETVRWDEPQLYQVIQWARSVGHDEIVRMIDAGEIEMDEWNQDVFGRWQPEVDVKVDEPRPFTEGARGQWFKTSGLLASWVHEGWNRIPANRWGVDNLLVLDLMSDHYGNFMVRTISAFPLSTYADVAGERKEHLWLYGVFFKNHSYETRYRSETGEGRPLTMPMFIVLHAEPRTYGDGGGDYRTAMTVIAIVIVVLGILFYVLFVRGERGELKREANRIAKRRARRERHGDGPPEASEGRGDAPPADDPPSEA